VRIRSFAFIAIVLALAAGCERGADPPSSGSLPYLVTEEHLRRYFAARRALETSGIPARTPSDLLAARRKAAETFEARVGEVGFGAKEFIRLVSAIEYALRHGDTLIRLHEETLKAAAQERDRLRAELARMPSIDPERQATEEHLSVIEAVVAEKEAFTRSETYRILRSNAELVRRFRQELEPAGSASPPAPAPGRPISAPPGEGKAGTGTAFRLPVPRRE